MKDLFSWHLHSRANGSGRQTTSSACASMLQCEGGRDGEGSEGGDQAEQRVGAFQSHTEFWRKNTLTACTETQMPCSGRY